MLILGIETSCDDTACAILEASGSLQKPNFKILSNIVSSQIQIHSEFGGIVPSLAARAHWKNIIPVLEKTFKEAALNSKKLSNRGVLRWLPACRKQGQGLVKQNTAIGQFIKLIDLIAVTKGPGLPPSLVSGVNTARLLSFIFKKPILGINHLEGHIYANFLNSPKIIFPAICLIVSGGHTQLILMKNYGNYEIIGETRDDAVGEAFDKTARLLGLGFPGGPFIAKLAQKGDSSAFKLPRPMMESKNYDFSFSGLKTAVLYLLEDLKKSGKKIDLKLKANLAASFEQAAVDVLVEKTLRAAKNFKIKTILIGGGVAANIKLKENLKMKIEKELPKISYIFPQSKLTTDNGAMIAAAGYFNWLKKKKSDDILKLEPDANLRLK